MNRNKLRNIRNFILFLILITLTLSGCSNETDSSEIGSIKSAYTKISADEAQKIMDENDAVIILDVRTEDEYAEGHIEGAILIPDTEIASEAETTLTDKSATILVYCRSGRRSALASEELVELGYTNIYDFGGIIDWKYEVVTD